MGYFQTAMGKLVTGEGSKKRDSAQHDEFNTEMKTQCVLGIKGFMAQKMRSWGPPELGCVLGAGVVTGHC